MEASSFLIIATSSAEGMDASPRGDPAGYRARRVNSVSLLIVTTLSTLKGATPETLACYKALRAEVCPETIIMLTQ